MIYLLFIALVLVWLFSMCVFDSLLVRGEAAMVPQPNISDEEFCNLMPDVPKEVAMKVRSVLVDASGWDREEIHPDTKLVEFEL